MMRKPSLIAFDAYGTLFDAGSGSVEATKRIFSRYLSECDPARIYARWKVLHRDRMKLSPFVKEAEIFRLDLIDLYAELNIVPQDASRDLQEMLKTLNKRAIFPEAAEVLSVLKRQYRIVIASNSDHEPLLLSIERNRVAVESVYSSESLGVYKPHSDFYLRLCERVGVAPEDVLYVGDSPEEDILGPKRVGMASAFVNRRGAEIESSFPAPDLEMVDLGGLLAALS